MIRRALEYDSISLALRAVLDRKIAKQIVFPEVPSVGQVKGGRQGQQRPWFCEHVDGGGGGVRSRDGEKGTQLRREPHGTSESKEYRPLPHQCDQEVTEAGRGSVLSDATGSGSSWDRNRF